MKHLQAWMARELRPFLWAPQEASDWNAFFDDQERERERDTETDLNETDRPSGKMRNVNYEKTSSMINDQ